ncbi:MAG: YbjQ family protein [Desulfovibrio sp.]|nr:YbjQ family protein [Desulfovibrio sp.]
MLFLLNGQDKSKRQKESCVDETTKRIKDLFTAGRFPVVTTDTVEGRAIDRVLGLVACRGYDSEEAFFGMASRAVAKGAQGIVGYKENVAFHPDGSKYFSCYGTAVQFASARTGAGTGAGATPALRPGATMSKNA